MCKFESSSIRVLFGLNRTTLPESLASLESRCKIVGKASTGDDLMKMAVTRSPDVIVIRHPQNGLDTLGVLEELREKLVPAVILVSTDCNTVLVRNIFARYGVSAFLPVDFPPDQFMRATETALKEAWMRRNPMKIIGGMTNTMGFRGNLSGTPILEEAVRLCLLNDDLLYSMKTLYGKIAERQGSQDVLVERNLRNAVLVAWAHTGAKKFSRVLSFRPAHDISEAEALSFSRPTNQQIIAMMTARIRHSAPVPKIHDLTRKNRAS